MTDTYGQLASTQSDDIEVYRGIVETAASGSKKSQVLFNRTPAHAAVITENIFRKAKSEIRILTRSLDASVYNTDLVVSAIRGFLTQSADARLWVLHEKPLDDSNLFVREIQRSEFRDQVSVMQVPELVQKRYKIHFAVGDSHFRIEPDRETCEAYCAFNAPEISAKFVRLFNELQSVSKSVSDRDNQKNTEQVLV